MKKERANTTKKMIWMFVLVLVMSFVLPSTTFAAKAKPDTETKTTYTIPAEEREADHLKQLEMELERQGLNKVLDGQPGRVSPKNDVNDYKVEWSSPRLTSVSGYPGNQPTNGVSFNPSGAMFYLESGGSMKSTSVNFGSPYGTVSFSFPLGNRADSNVGYSVDVKKPGRYKLYVVKTYEVKSYIVYKKVWIDDFHGYVWQPQGGGSTSTLYAVNLSTKKVG